jgi:hypothetical protein
LVISESKLGIGCGIPTVKIATEGTLPSAPQVVFFNSSKIYLFFVLASSALDGLGLAPLMDGQASHVRGHKVEGADYFFSGTMR